MKYAIGLDLGGTKTAVALVTPQGRILKHLHLPTPQAHEFTSPRKHIHGLVDHLADAVLQMVGEAPVKKNILGLGLASAGPMNVQKGQLVYPANFAGWKTVPIVEMLEKALRRRRVRLPLHFQNDAIAAALGEGWTGGAKNCHTYVVVTIGTGIGTGVILNGRPAQFLGMGAEWGHQIVELSQLQNNNVNTVSVEGLASGSGILRRARAMGFAGHRVEELVEKIHSGEQHWLSLFDDAAKALAALFYNLSLGFHPQRILVSGGMIQIRDLFLNKARGHYADWIHAKNPHFEAPVSVAKLGTRAGVLGAARLVFMDPEF